MSEFSNSVAVKRFEAIGLIQPRADLLSLSVFARDFLYLRRVFRRRIFGELLLGEFSRLYFDQMICFQRVFLSSVRRTTNLTFLIGELRIRMVSKILYGL